MMPLPLYIFAKVPIAGKVKTRLMPYCSAQQAADIAKILLKQTVLVAKKNWPGTVILSVANATEQDVVDLRDEYRLTIHQQIPGDLGEKMAAIFLENTTPLAIIGADAALMQPSHFIKMHTALTMNQDIIGPCVDGGYYAIGLCQQQVYLFEGIAWGEDTVFADTMRTASNQNLTMKELSILHDIDRWQDVKYSAEYIPALYEYLSQQNLL